MDGNQQCGLSGLGMYTICQTIISCRKYWIVVRKNIWILTGLGPGIRILRIRDCQSDGDHLLCRDQAVQCDYTRHHRAIGCTRTTETWDRKPIHLYCRCYDHAERNSLWTGKTVRCQVEGYREECVYPSRRRRTPPEGREFSLSSIQTTTWESLRRGSWNFNWWWFAWKWSARTEDGRIRQSHHRRST
jgi:hypothetical protein